MAELVKDSDAFADALIDLFDTLELEGEPSVITIKSAGKIAKIEVEFEGAETQSFVTDEIFEDDSAIADESAEKSEGESVT